MPKNFQNGIKFRQAIIELTKIQATFLLEHQHHYHLFIKIVYG